LMLRIDMNPEASKSSVRSANPEQGSFEP